MLTTAQAGSYCGLTPQAFLRACPVRAISYAPDGRDDPKHHRFDVQKIDAWLDAVVGGGQTSDAHDDAYWLAKIG